MIPWRVPLPPFIEIAPKVKVTRVQRQKLARVLSVERLAGLGIDTPSLTRITPAPLQADGQRDWIGCTAWQGGEPWIELDPAALTWPDSSLLALVLHEVAHVVTDGRDHDTVFWAVELTLCRRAFPESWSLFAGNLYNFRDSLEHLRAVEHLTWAVRYSAMAARSTMGGALLGQDALESFLEIFDEGYQRQRPPITDPLALYRDTERQRLALLGELADVRGELSQAYGRLAATYGELSDAYLEIDRLTRAG